MNFRASEFEFRYRFFFIGGIFWLGFSLYFLDKTNVSFSTARMILGKTASANSPQLDRYTQVIIGLGALIAALAALIRSWAEAYLHSSVVHDMELHSDRLVADGPYRHVRNPLYLGNILLAVGMGTMASRAGFFVLAAGMTLLCYRLILREEAGLLESHGESYRGYFQSVPRLWPSLRPRVPAGARRPNWLDGFLGETFMWAFAIAIAVFAWTERLVHFWIIVGAGLAVYFLQNSARKKSENSVE